MLDRCARLHAAALPFSLLEQALEDVPRGAAVLDLEVARIQ